MNKSTLAITQECEAKQIGELEKKVIELSREEKSRPKDRWSECECEDCGYVWQAIETEHFNFTWCEICYSNNIEGYGKF